MSTALKREVYGRGRGDLVLAKRTGADLEAVHFRNMVLLRSTDIGSLAFIFGHCRLGYPLMAIKSIGEGLLTLFNV